MEQQLGYKRINTPLNLFYLMDANCTKVFITLIQMNSYYPKEDGHFECAYKTLELACGLSQNLIKASLAGLYLEGVIDVFSIGKGRGKHTNRYKVNVEKFKDYEKTPVGIAIMTEDKPIHQAKYKGTRFRVPWPFYKDAQEYAQHTAQSIAQSTAQKVTTNIDNITNIENIDNTKEYNIITKEEDNMLVNVVEDKDTFYDDTERNVVMVIEEETVKEEPTAIKNTTPTVNIEDSQDDSIFFNEFLGNPIKDYSDLFGDVTAFIKMNKTELNILNHKLTEYHHQEPSARYILNNLQYYYQEKINRQSQERTQSA